MSALGPSFKFACFSIKTSWYCFIFISDAEPDGWNEFRWTTRNWGHGLGWSPELWPHPFYKFMAMIIAYFRDNIPLVKELDHFVSILRKAWSHFHSDHPIIKPPSNENYPHSFAAWIVYHQPIETSFHSRSQLKWHIFNWTVVRCQLQQNCHKWFDTHLCIFYCF